MKKNGIKSNIALSLALVVFLLVSSFVGFGVVSKRSSEECLTTLKEAAGFADVRFIVLFRSHVGALANIGDLFVSDESKIWDKANIEYFKNIRIGPLHVPLRLYHPSGFVLTQDGGKTYPVVVAKYGDLVSPAPYISKVHEDFLNSDRNIIEQFFPIRVRGRIVAMLAAVIDVSELHSFFTTDVYEGRAKIKVVDRRDSVVVMDSENENVYKINELRKNKALFGLSFDKWIDDVMQGRKSRFAYENIDIGSNQYISSIPSLVENYTMMVEVDENVVFEKARLIKNIFIALTVLQFIAFLVYLICMLRNMKKRVESENREYSEIANVLSESFESIYYVDVVDETYTEYHGQSDSKKLVIETSGTHFFTEVQRNLKAVAYSEDLEAISSFMSKDYFIDTLKNGNMASLEYRLVVEGVPVYYRLKAICSGRSSNHVIIAVENVDEEVNKTILQRRKIERNNSMIESLAADFDCVNYIEVGENKCDDVIEQYRLSKTLIKCIPGWFEEMRFSKKLGLMLKYFVVDSEKDSFYARTRREVIFKHLSTDSVYFVNFKANENGVERFYQIKFIADFDIYKCVKGFVFGIHCIDEEFRQQLEIQESLKYNLEIINILSEDYVDLYSVNLIENSWKLLSLGNPFSVERDEDSYVSDNVQKRFCDFVEQNVHPDDVKLVEKFKTLDGLREILAHQRRFTLVFRCKYDGVYKYTRMILAKSEDTDEEPVIVAIGFTEIDGLYRAELERQENIDRVMSLSEEFESIYEVNLDTGEYNLFLKTGKISEKVIKKMQNSGDFFKDSIINVSRVIYEDDRQTLLNLYTPEHVIERLEKENTFGLDYRCVVDGGVYWYKMKLTKIGDWSKERRMLVGIFNNDENHKREMARQTALEEALQMAKSASRAKTTFLNNMSHDIRTPMNAIIGYTGLAATHIDNKEQVENYLGKIAQSSDHLLSLINDVLDMSRIESGKMNLNEKSENIPDIVHMLRDIVQADVHSKQIDFFVDSVDIADENVICDKLRLNQVLLNILSNAIKYTPVRGIISMRIIQKAIKRSGYALYEFRVKDNGIGMNEEFLKTIYDPFTRVKSSTVSGIQGTGLGMTITKNIVTMMGGSIDIKSEENVGTEVIVDFEFKLSGEPNCTEKIAEVEGMKCLVVDDDTNTCRSISKMLRDVGMRSEWCASGKEAIIRTEDALQNGDLYKTYIIDWLMPDMNGIETARRLRRIIGKDAAIIILTAYDWSDIEDEAIEAGVSDFVSKPMFPSDMRKVLRKFYGKEELVEPEKNYDLSGKKVLLVEDNLLNQEISVEILEDLGMEVSVASNGLIAVDKVKNSKPGDWDVILMDVQMPIMNGYEATRQIRAMENKAISDIPIIAMTANAFAEDQQLALESGMNEHIAKPVNIEKLKDILARFLNAPPKE